MKIIEEYLREAVSDGASDVFLTPGSPVREKIGKDVRPMRDDRLMPDQVNELIRSVYQAADRETDLLTAEGDDDFSFAVPGLARFRVNAYKQRGTYGAVLRTINFDIPTPDAMGIPDEVMRIADLEHGLAIITGAAGSGKSTTIACVVDRINATKQRHIITLEDPIEFLHRNDMSIVTQREIHLDSSSYAKALRACLRQAPDVICLGEMRDPETIQTAITAAETGHLVLGTLHTKGAANAMDRVIDSFPPEQQQQIRTQLAMVLETVVSQQLVPGTDGRPVALFEIMRATTNVRTLIRDARSHQLDNAIASGAQDGMVSMDMAIRKALMSGRISKEAAVSAHPDPDRFRKTI